MGRQKDIDIGGGVFARPGRRKKHLKPYTTLYETNLKDIPGFLRKIAKQVESGDLAMANEAVLVLDCADGSYPVMGFGPHNDGICSSMVLLEMGIEELKWMLLKAKEAQEEAYVPEPPKGAA